MITFTLALIQAFGAVFGAGGSVIAELFYLEAIRDGRIDRAEKLHMRLIARALRVGMMVVLISSIALVLNAFVYETDPQPAFTSPYWMEMFLVFLVIFSSWALSRKMISFTLGSAATFTGWWFLALLVLGRIPALTVGAGLAYYIVATALIAVVLHYARMIVQA